MTRSVALLGATGYTGRLTAAELERRGIAHRVGGRSKARLADVPSSGERYVVDLADPSSLDAFLSGVDVVISCVGPFLLHGWPAVEAAVRGGVPYVDSTGEPAFMAEVYRRYRDKGPALVPACGFDYVPGDLGAAVAAAELGRRPEQIDVVYAMAGGGATRGTAKSGIGIVTSGRPKLGRLVIPGLSEAVRLPWGEEVTVPLHQPQAVVRTGIAAPSWATRVTQVVGPVSPALSPLLKLARPLLERAVDRMPEGPSPQSRAETRCTTWSVARAGTDEVRVEVKVRDAYGITARFLVAASQQIAGTGALATAEALDPRGFLDAMSYDDEGGALSWSVL
ncbi:MAG: Saccharopine dehydrogenase [Frankiales bacterium]|nr:Saccharopine dehydrogenase [Frankiales bacterium]